MIIPIFPLQLIVFPGEELNLHIFEKKYLELFRDLKNQEALYFGIPPVVDNKINAFGTRLILTNIVKTYPSGEMDVSTKGLDAFKVTNVLEQTTEKLYTYAEVEVLANNQSYNFLQFEELKELYLAFQALMVDKKEINATDGNGYSFKIAHYIALSEEQKLTLLEILDEATRQDFLISHLKTIIPAMKNIKETQGRITANGHFKNLKSFNFNKPD